MQAEGVGLHLQMGLEYTAVFIFALTGALVASRKQLDIVGFIFIAAVTAVGGGTLRDLVLGRTPIWIVDQTFIGVATVAALLVFFLAHKLESRYNAILWLDAFALAVAVPAGVAASLDMGMDWGVVLIMGIATGCFGGLMRDVICNEVPLVLQAGEPYVTCAFLGALAALGALGLGLSAGWVLIMCGLVTLVTRAGALAFGWRIPVYKSRPPRPRPPA